MRSSFSFTVGRLLCGKVRDFLYACQVRGRDIKWYESSGWFEREFTVSGEHNDVIYVVKMLRDYADAVNKECT